MHKIRRWLAMQIAIAVIATPRSAGAAETLSASERAQFDRFSRCLGLVAPGYDLTKLANARTGELFRGDAEGLASYLDLDISTEACAAMVANRSANVDERFIGHLGLVIAFAKSKQYDRALAETDDIATLDHPSAYGEAHILRGWLFELLGRYDEAAEEYGLVVRPAPNAPSVAIAYAQRGNVYLKLQRFDESIADSQQALRLRPQLTFVAANLKTAQDAKEALLRQARVAGTGARVALVIGNSRYANSPLLRNAANDAADVAQELRKLGFKIFGFPKTDFGKRDLEAAIEEFKQAVDGSSAAVVWYSGHGQQMLEDGSIVPNDWIIPVDATIGKRADVAPNAIRLDNLRYAVLAARPLRVVVIDACRNNTFYTGDRATRGLSRNPYSRGVLTVYSTQPGDIAQDGEGRNSPFAQAFLDVIRATPRSDVRLLFSAVQGGVSKLTHNEQRPQIDDGLGSAENLPLAP